MAKFSTPSAQLQFETASNGSVAGTSSSSGVTVTGVGSSFTSELQTGDIILNAAGDERRIVTAIASDTELTINRAFDTDLSSETITKVVFSEVIQVQGVSMSESANTVDVSDLSSDAYSDTIPGRKTGGTWDFSIWWDPSNSVHQAMRTAFDATQTANQLKGARMWFPTSATAVPDVSNHRVTAIVSVTDWGIEVQGDSALEASLQFTVSRAPEFTNG